MALVNASLVSYAVVQVKRPHMKIAFMSLQLVSCLVCMVSPSFAGIPPALPSLPELRAHGQASDHETSNRWVRMVQQQM
jgi:hypothetical protein